MSLKSLTKVKNHRQVFIDKYLKGPLKSFFYEPIMFFYNFCFKMLPSNFDQRTDFIFIQKMLAGRQVVTQVRCSSGKLKELGVRLRSIRNIEKITKTMKMISSAKFAKVMIMANKFSSRNKYLCLN